MRGPVDMCEADHTTEGVKVPSGQSMLVQLAVSEALPETTSSKTGSFASVSKPAAEVSV